MRDAVLFDLVFPTAQSEQYLGKATYSEFDDMIRKSLIGVAIAFSLPLVLSADEGKNGLCTILNTTDHPTVIGLYLPTKNGIKEQLVSVPAKTQVENIAVRLVDDAQFVIAYQASNQDGSILRSTPITIVGQKLMRQIRKKSPSEIPDVLIHFRGGSSIHRAALGQFDNALYLPRSEIEAKRVIRNANQSSQVVDTPLAKVDHLSPDGP